MMEDVAVMSFATEWMWEQGGGLGLTQRQPYDTGFRRDDRLYLTFWGTCSIKSTFLDQTSFEASAFVNAMASLVDP